MHGFDFLGGSCIVVTPNIISDMSSSLDTVLKRAHIYFLWTSFWLGWSSVHSLFGLAKGPHFLNMVMTFVLHPLSHYNSITKDRARFLLSLFEHLTIDFPSHFILSILDIYRDTTSCDKLIFLAAITRILSHFSVPFLVSDHFHVMCAINAATVKRSKAQLHLRRSESTAPPIPSTWFTSTPSTSVGGVTLDAIMAQPQHVYVHIDTLSTELYQVNTRVSRIARREACLGGFVESPSPPPKASKASEDDDDSNDDDDNDEDRDASSSSSDKMSTWYSYPLSLMTKRGK